MEHFSIQKELVTILLRYVLANAAYACANVPS